MTIQDAFELIKNTRVCYSCRYRNSGCDKKEGHVWTDGYCHLYNEAIAIVEEFIPQENPETPEPQTTEP